MCVCVCDVHRVSLPLRLQDVLGYTKKDLLGRTIFALHHHEDLSVTEACSHRGNTTPPMYRLLGKKFAIFVNFCHLQKFKKIRAVHYIQYASKKVNVQM